MFFGSYNRAHQAAGGITNFYASEAALCSSGERHQPKFSHYAALHAVMRDIAPTLLAAPTALWRSMKVKTMNKNGNWTEGKKQRAFEYDASTVDGIDHRNMKHIMFVENDANEQVVIQLITPSKWSLSTREFSMAPTSSLVLIDGMMAFDSARIDPQTMSFKRETIESSRLLDWSCWSEPIGASRADEMVWRSRSPIEMTRLNVGSAVFSQYAWYETTVNTSERLDDVQLSIESQRSNGLLIFLDGDFVGDVEDHSHVYEGDWMMVVNISSLSSGNHTLSILSESFGYSNLIGRFGNSRTGPKTKGITGDVLLSVGRGRTNFSLVDGREWFSFAGLHGETSLDKVRDRGQRQLGRSDVPAIPAWYSALFDTPTYNPSNERLFLEIVSGRGHLWLNGRDLGRFWNITRGETLVLTQPYYFLPPDYLRYDGTLNELVIFDVFGSEHADKTRLVLSSIISSENPNFKDEVSYPSACI
jgi:hypothetical protein